MQDSLFSQNRNQFNALLDNNQDFGIIVSSNQTMDNMAAALSLYLALADSGKNAQLVSTADAKVEVSNLVGIDKLKKSFDGIVKQFVIALPYRENEIEKISYNAEGATLNINVIAGEGGITFSEKDIKIQKTGSTPSVIFAIGIQSQEELQAFVQPDPNLKVINIDNSGVNAQYGDILYVSPSFSSISEVAGKLIYDSGLVLEQDTAQNLMNGIVASTADFAHPNTSPTAFETAGILLRHGAIRQKIKMNDKKDQIRPEFQPKQKQQFQPQNQPHKQNQHGGNGQVRPNQPQFNQQQAQTQPQPMPNPVPQMPVDENVPNDWFTPKVFKGSKGQQE